MNQTPETQTPETRTPETSLAAEPSESNADATSRPTLLRDERGGMYAEAVIVLPVFILVWSLIAFVNHGYRRTLTVGTQTRGAGWAHVMGQCQEDVEDPVESVEQSTMYSGLLTTLSAAIQGGGRVAICQPGIINPVSLGSGMSRIRAVSFTFDAYRYQQTESIDRPRAIGGSAELGHHIDLVCDEIHDQVNLTAWIVLAYGTIETTGICN